MTRLTFSSDVLGKIKHFLCQMCSIGFLTYASRLSSFCQYVIKVIFVVNITFFPFSVFASQLLPNNIWTNASGLASSTVIFGNNSGLYLDGVTNISGDSFGTTGRNTNGSLFISGDGGLSQTNLTIGTLRDSHGHNVVIGGAPISGVNVAVYFADTSSDSSNILYNGSTHITTSASSSLLNGSISAASATLYLTGNASLAKSTGVYFDTGNTALDISNINTSSTSIKTLNGSNNTSVVALGSKTLRLTNANDTFSGSISGTGGLTIAGGRETLSGINTYTGDTVIRHGATLALLGAGAITNSDAIYNKGKLDLTKSVSDIIAFNGSYTQSSHGKLIITDAGTTTGNFEQLSFSGKAKLGGTLSVKSLSGKVYKMNDKYTLLTAKKISKQFLKMKTNFGSLLNPYLSYDAKNVYLNLAPNQSLTLQSVKQNVQGISAAINIQSAAIQSGLTYNCDKFDRNGICVSVGGRYTHANTISSSKDQAGLIIIGYKPVKNFHFGVFADQAFDTPISSRINRNNNGPMWGFFGNWNLDKSGDGLGVQASTAFANNKFAISRAGTTYNEAGQGNARVTSQGYQVQANYTQPIVDTIKVIPYFGLRYARINNGAYTENKSDTVLHPLSYNSMTQNSFAALAGLGVSGKLIKKLTGALSVGLQQNLNYNIDKYTGTSQIPNLTNFSIEMPGNKNTLATASAGIFYDTTRYGCLGLNVYWQQQSFVGTNTTTVLATYTIKM